MSGFWAPFAGVVVYLVIGARVATWLDDSIDEDSEEAKDTRDLIESTSQHLAVDGKGLRLAIFFFHTILWPAPMTLWVVRSVQHRVGR